MPFALLLQILLILFGVRSYADIPAYTGFRDLFSTALPDSQVNPCYGASCRLYYGAALLLQILY